MKLLALVKTKALLTAIAGVLLVGGATVAFAATPDGQHIIQSFAQKTVTVLALPTHQPKGTPASDHSDAACPGQPEAQNLAAKYRLSEEQTGNAITAICALHAGTFEGTTINGTSVKVKRVYGYGEIDQILSYAQSLAEQDSANAGGKLSDLNVNSYIANALRGCGSTPVEACVKSHVPGNGKKPTINGKKPDATSTPHGNKPDATPTPHH